MQKKIDVWRESAIGAIKSGENPPILYKWILVPVPTEINEVVSGSIDFAELQAAGLQGWKIYSVIPKTVGLGLKNGNLNNLRETWGGGIGGNVVGAYVLVGKQLSSLEDADGEFATELATALLSSGVEL